jgi:hypothetical protein
VRETRKLASENARLRLQLAERRPEPPAPSEETAPRPPQFVLRDGTHQWLNGERGQFVQAKVAPPPLQLALNATLQFPPELGAVEERGAMPRDETNSRTETSAGRHGARSPDALERAKDHRSSLIGHRHRSNVSPSPPDRHSGPDTDSPVSLVLRAPVGMVLSEEQPRFSWDPVPGASGYRLVVTDFRSSNRIVAQGETGSPGATEWTPPSPLPRGRIYEWQVIAVMRDGVLARARPARFKVLDRAELEELAAARKTGSHLTLGVVLARVGLLEQAEQEFRALQTENPSSALPAKLLASIKARRELRR